MIELEMITLEGSLCQFHFIQMPSNMTYVFHPNFILLDLNLEPGLGLAMSNQVVLSIIS